MFGLYTTEQRRALDVAMSGIVLAVKEAVAKAKLKIAISDWRLLLAVAGPLGIALGTTEETRNAIYSYLKTIETVLNRLDGPSRAEVLGETLPFSKWQAGIQPLFDGIVDQLKALKSDTVAAQVKAQYDDFMKRAKEILNKGVEWLPWVVGGAVTVGLIGLLSQVATTVAVAQAFRPRRRFAGVRAQIRHR